MSTRIRVEFDVEAAVILRHALAVALAGCCWDDTQEAVLVATSDTLAEQLGYDGSSEGADHA